MADEVPELSAFERRRAENIKRNNAILAAISNSTTPILSVPKRTPTKPKAKSTPRKKPAARISDQAPTRRSSRLVATNTTDPAEFEAVKRKLEVDAEAEAALQPNKKIRIDNDFTLEEATVDGKAYKDSAAGLSMLGLQSPAVPGKRLFKPPKDRDAKAVKDLRESLGELSFYEKFAHKALKITPARIYSIGFHPTEDKPIVFAGDKEGVVGIFDASQEPEEKHDEDEDQDDTPPKPVLSAFKIHTRTITDFFFPEKNSKVVYTSSYDCSIRKIDLDSGIATEMYGPATSDHEQGITCLEMNTPNTFLFTTLMGHMGFYDMRQPPKTVEWWYLSDVKIGGFSMHRGNSHLIATAGLDRTMKLWDVRKIVGQDSSRHPALIGEHSSRLSVSHASWNKEGQVVTSSYDDTVKLYNFRDAANWKVGHSLGDKEMEPARVIPHNNQSGRWVSILKPHWQANPADGIPKFAIGDMNRFVDIYDGKGREVIQLTGDEITAVPAVARFHPSQNWVAGGNGSGKLCLWT